MISYDIPIFIMKAMLKAILRLAEGLIDGQDDSWCLRKLTYWGHENVVNYYKACKCLLLDDSTRLEFVSSFQN